MESHLIGLARRAARLPNLPVIVILALVFSILGGLIGIIPLALYFGTADVNQLSRIFGDAPSRTGLAWSLILICSFGPFYLFIWAWLRLYERRPFWTLGFELPGWAAKYLRGVAAGLTCFGAAVAVMAACGYVAPEQGPAQSQGLGAVGGVLAVLAGWVVQGAAEEVVCRGWVLPVIGARYRAWLGVLISSLVFTILHGLNPNLSAVALLNLFLVGLFLALYALAEGGLWGVCAWHTAWNWAQGNLFGLEVSGMRTAGGMLLNLVETGPDVVTGGAFGPEGGLAVTLVIGLGIGALLLFRVRAAKLVRA